MLENIKIEHLEATIAIYDDLLKNTKDLTSEQSSFLSGCSNILNKLKLLTSDLIRLKDRERFPDSFQVEEFTKNFTLLEQKFDQYLAFARNRIIAALNEAEILGCFLDKNCEALRLLARFKPNNDRDPISLEFLKDINEEEKFYSLDGFCFIFNNLTDFAKYTNKEIELLNPLIHVPFHKLDFDMITDTGFTRSFFPLFLSSYKWQEFCEQKLLNPKTQRKIVIGETEIDTCIKKIAESEARFLTRLNELAAKEIAGTASLDEIAELKEARETRKIYIEFDATLFVRVLLTSTINSPHDWSVSFYFIFSEVLAFVKNNLITPGIVGEFCKPIKAFLLQFEFTNSLYKFTHQISIDINDLASICLDKYEISLLQNLDGYVIVPNKYKILINIYPWESRLNTKPFTLEQIIEIYNSRRAKEILLLLLTQPALDALNKGLITTDHIVEISKHSFADMLLETLFTQTTLDALDKRVIEVAQIVEVDLSELHYLHCKIILPILFNPRILKILRERSITFNQAIQIYKDFTAKVFSSITFNSEVAIAIYKKIITLEQLMELYNNCSINYCSESFFGILFTPQVLDIIDKGLIKIELIMEISKHHDADNILAILFTQSVIEALDKRLIKIELFIKIIVEIYYSFIFNKENLVILFTPPVLEALGKDVIKIEHIAAIKHNKHAEIIFLILFSTPTLEAINKKLISVDQIIEIEKQSYNYPKILSLLLIDAYRLDVLHLLNIEHIIAIRQTYGYDAAAELIGKLITQKSSITALQDNLISIQQANIICASKIYYATYDYTRLDVLLTNDRMYALHKHHYSTDQLIEFTALNNYAPILRNNQSCVAIIQSLEPQLDIDKISQHLNEIVQLTGAIHNPFSAFFGNSSNDTYLIFLNIIIKHFISIPSQPHLETDYAQRFETIDGKIYVIDTAPRHIDALKHILSEILQEPVVKDDYCNSQKLKPIYDLANTLNMDLPERDLHVSLRATFEIAHM